VSSQDANSLRFGGVSAAQPDREGDTDNTNWLNETGNYSTTWFWRKDLFPPLGDVNFGTVSPNRRPSV